MVALVMMEPQPPKREARPYLRLGRRIAELRHRQGWGQREFARMVPVSIGYLPKIEGGKSLPAPATLRKMALLLDVPFHELTTLTGYCDPPPIYAVEVAPEVGPDVVTFSRFPMEARRVALAAGQQAARFLRRQIAESRSEAYQAEERRRTRRCPKGEDQRPD